MEDLSGRTLKGRYALTRVIGRGGMGIVYEAVHLDLARKVAVKALFDHDERALSRFRQEALASAAVHHPNLIAVSDFHGGDTEDPPFIVMELLLGEPLSQLLARTKPLDVRRAVLIATQMLEGLSALHAAGIVHRDVKPGNVFLITLPGTGYLVKILDLGIAKLLEDESGVRTTTGRFVGTPAYVAPEQVKGGTVDGRTDVHAVSAVLHEMLEGQRPYHAGQGFEIISQILRAPPPRITNPQVPPPLADIIQRGLAKEKEDRWPSAAAMRDALRPWLEAAPPPEAEITQADRKSALMPPIAAPAPSTLRGAPTRLDAPVTRASSPSLPATAQSHPHTMPHGGQPPPYQHQPSTAAYAATPLQSHALPPPAKRSLVPLFIGLGLVGLVGLGGVALAVMHFANDAGAALKTPTDVPPGTPPITSVTSLTTASPKTPAPGPAPRPVPSPPPSPPSSAPNQCPASAPDAKPRGFELKLLDVGDGSYGPSKDKAETGRAWWYQNEAAIRTACFQKRTCWTDIYFDDHGGKGTCPASVIPPPSCDSTTDKCLVAYAKAHAPPRVSQCKADGSCPSLSFHVTTVQP
jgi:serine/threonine-protein kinase